MPVLSMKQTALCLTDATLLIRIKSCNSANMSAEFECRNFCVCPGRLKREKQDFTACVNCSIYMMRFSLHIILTKIDIVLCG